MQAGREKAENLWVLIRGQGDKRRTLQQLITFNPSQHPVGVSISLCLVRSRLNCTRGTQSTREVCSHNAGIPYSTTAYPGWSEFAYSSKR